MEWFEYYYIRGRVKCISRSGNIIQNFVEAWHRKWEVLVSSAHVSVFKIIMEIQKEQN
ncbi:hypothetical protein C1645_813287 [Glomus cerebriforme]|uniref:Uncharacterized protein n=1 Tax=Glomus cerebriforme TaxID=658196 RepID=A0A397TMA4_9GLOM|nr:hypothetical protein C1645_813287 [Glomus cerebriforme]